MASELIHFNENAKRFEVPSQALTLLRSLNGLTCVVAVCGRSREGKSFLLNQLITRLQGSGTTGAQRPSHGVFDRFAVGSTVKPCTKGLWLWSRPLQRKLPDGQTCNVLLLDAEGIDAYNQTADYSNHIFSLALLLSSVLIFNQMGSIDESSVENLARVCKSACLIRSYTDAGGGTSRAAASTATPRDLSPAFFWLLRDFQLQLKEAGRQITHRDYMEKVLEELPGTSAAIRSKNQSRASIKALFPDRECHALVRPVHDEARLSRMDTLPLSELRPEFRQGLDSLSDLILQRCRPKTLHGSPLTGSMLAGLAETYCRVINEGRVPTILSTWQSVVQAECTRALDTALELYRSRLEEARGHHVGPQALEGIHTAALEAAVETFRKQAMGSSADQETSLQRLRETAASLIEPLRHTKRAEAQARALELLEAAAKIFRESIFVENSDLPAAVSRLHDFLREYGRDESLGPDKYIWAAEFLGGTIIGELVRLVQETRSQKAAAMEQIVKLEASAAQLSKGMEIQRENLREAALTDAQRRRELAAAKAEAATARDVLAGAEILRSNVHDAALTDARRRRELAAAHEALAAAEKEAVELQEQLAAARVEIAARADGSDSGASRLLYEMAVIKAQRQAAEDESQAAKAAHTVLVQQLAAKTAEMEGMRTAMEAAQTEARRLVESQCAQLAAREGATRAHMPARGGPHAAATSTPPQPTVSAKGKRSRTMADVGASARDDDGDVEMVMMEGTAIEGTSSEQRPSRRQCVSPTTGVKTPAAATAGGTTPAGTTPVVPIGTGSAAGDRVPFSTEREVKLSKSRVWIGATTSTLTTTTTASPVQGGSASHHGATNVAGDAAATTTTTAAGAAGTRPQLPVNLDTMTVNELKCWLTQHGWEQEVSSLSRVRSFGRKEWAEHVRAKCQAGPVHF